MNGTQFSVVISSHSEERWSNLIAAVESLNRQTLPPREIIVVVDHNRGLFERARDRWPDLVVVESRERAGLSGARNTGLAHAQGSFVAFLDDDAFAEPDWLERLASHYGGSTVMGVGGAVVPHWVEPRPAWFPPEFDWVIGCSHIGMPQTTSKVRNMIGANMSFRRDVLDGLNGFRHGLGRIGVVPLGCEETDLCIRAGQRWAAGVFVYEPAARVCHEVPPNRSTWAYFVSRCYGEGVSKALLSGVVGVNDALASERHYVLRILPRGAVNALATAIRDRDIAYAARVAALVVGLTATVGGFVATSLRSNSRLFQKGPGSTIAANSNPARERDKRSRLRA
jgi:glycosyltransferase involved in cell wall biosynthesis